MPQPVLVNFAPLDPPHNGGVSRIGWQVARLLLDMPDMRPIFAVNWAFAAAFTDWLGDSACVVPIIGGGKIAAQQAHRIVRAIQPHLIISPLFGLEPFAPDFGIPHLAGMPDTLVLDHPEQFSAEELRYRRAVYDGLRRAARVVTISQFAKERLIAHLGLRDEQIAVAYLGGDNSPSPPAPLPRKRGEGSKDSTTGAYAVGERQASPENNPHPLAPSPLHGEGGSKTSNSIPKLPARYWLYPANVWAHKRHDLLLRAFALAQAREPSLRLVLTGSPEPFTAKLLPLIRALSLSDESVIHLGYVSDDVLAAAYRRAAAVVFTSEYEGFGMPLLEAMQAGCPVVCAPLAALPEIAGDAALYVESADPQAWANAVLDDLPHQRELLTARGYARARLFTWEKTRAVWQAVIEAAAVPVPAPAAQRNGENTRQPDDDRQDRLLEQVEQARRGANGRLGKALALPRLWQIQGQLLALARDYLQQSG